MRVPKFLQTAFRRVRGHARTMAQVLPGAPLRRDISFFLLDATNRSIFLDEKTPLILRISANPDRLSDERYRRERAAMAVIKAIGLKQVGSQTLSQVKGFKLTGYPGTSAANVYAIADRFLSHPEYGARLLGDKVHQARVILHTANRASLRAVEGTGGYSPTVHADLFPPGR